jgi:hypothetical protein
MCDVQCNECYVQCDVQCNECIECTVFDSKSRETKNEKHLKRFSHCH